jgi:hypothetical protein
MDRQTLDFYNANSADPAQRYAEAASAVSQLFPIAFPAATRVLDIGCGSGIVVRHSLQHSPGPQERRPSPDFDTSRRARPRHGQPRCERPFVQQRHSREFSMETVYIETTIVSYLVANPSQKQLRAIMAARGLTLPEMCTPVELGGQRAMKSNPILEEVWRIKDELAREANYDIHQFCETTRRWIAEHPHTGPVVRNAEELRQPPMHANRRESKTRSSFRLRTLSGDRPCGG